MCIYWSLWSTYYRYNVSTIIFNKQTGKVISDRMTLAKVSLVGVIQLCKACPSGFWICFLSSLTGWLKHTQIQFATKVTVRAYSFWCYLIQLFFGFIGKGCFPEFSFFVFLCNECNPFFCRGIHVQLFIRRKISCPKSVCSLIPNDDKELKLKRKQISLTILNSFQLL